MLCAHSMLLCRVHSLPLLHAPLCPSVKCRRAGRCRRPPILPFTRASTEDEKQDTTKPVLPTETNKQSSRTPPQNTTTWEKLTKALSTLPKPTVFLRILFNVLAFSVLFKFMPFPHISNPDSSELQTIAGKHVLIKQTADGALVFPVSYSDFIHHVRNNDIRSVVVEGDTLTYALKRDNKWVQQLLQAAPGLEKLQVNHQHLVLTTTRPADYPTPYETLFRNNVRVIAQDKKAAKGFSSIWTFVFGFLVLATVLNKFSVRGLGQKGPGRRHLSNAKNSGKVATFDDVAGVDEAKEELREIVDFLKAPDKFVALGARPPCGVLLTGPPGTGKTLLARAVAGEAGVPFFSISASEFVELFVGMGASRVRELFAAARKEAPAIVFIDEIDAVAKGRDSRLRSVGNDEREQTLNQLLTELDGFDQHKDSLVICLAATNRPDVLDPALLRPGRFDRRVSVERPDRQGREHILKVHMERKCLPLADDVNVSAIAAATTGFTGADLANLVNEAALLAGREDRKTVSAFDFDTAIVRTVAGIEKKGAVLADVEKSVVARHEAGHALVATAISKIIPSLSTANVEKLSIIPRTGGALGFTYIPPSTDDRALLFDSEIRGRLAMLMGGRAAEMLTCDAVSTGASDDIKRASELARQAISEWGLSPVVGPLSVGVLGASGSGGDDIVFPGSGGEVAKAAEKEARLMLERSLAEAKEVLLLNKALHMQLSNQLETSERIEGPQLKELLEKTRVPPSLKEFVLSGLYPEL